MHARFFRSWSRLATLSLLLAAAALAFGLAQPTQAAGPFYISEILFNPQGMDSPNEYIELRGAASTTIPANTYLVGVEGGFAAERGFVHDIFSISGLATGSNGYLVLLQKSSPYTVSGSATSYTNSGTGAGWGSSAATSSFGVAGTFHAGQSGQTDIENGSSSFFLIQTSTAPALGNDIDTNDDGTPDGAVWTAWTILDSVGVTASVTGELAYSDVNYVRTGGIGRPGAANVAVTFEVEYLARRGASSGSALADWMGADVTGSAGSYSIGANIEPAACATQTIPGTLGTVNVCASSVGNPPTIGAGIPDGRSGVIGYANNQVFSGLNNGYIGGFDFSVSDDVTAADSILVTVTNGNPAVLSSAAVVDTGSGTWRLDIGTPAGAVGYSNVVVTAEDGDGNETTETFVYAASTNTGTLDTEWYTGAADASSAIFGEGGIVFDDEDEVLRLYIASGLPFQTSTALTPTSGAPLNLDGSGREVDFEASAYNTDTNLLYIIGSHGNSSDGSLRPNRQRLIQGTLDGNFSLINITYYQHLRTDLIAWDSSDAHGLGADFFGIDASTDAGDLPEALDGFNIEGLAISPDGTQMFVGFRAPIIPATNRTKALIIPITNYGSITSTTGGTAGSAAFGAPIQLDLGGRGIRSIECGMAVCIIIAGPATASGTFALYTWTGNAVDAPVLRAADLTGLRPEGLAADFSAPLTDSSPVLVFSDNGDDVYYGDAIIAKDLAIDAHKKFRADLIELGAPVTTEPIVPTCASPQSITSGTTANFGGYSATDADSIVNSVVLTTVTPASAAFSLTSITPASADGGALTFTVTVAGSAALGSYDLLITFGNNESQTITCNVTVVVNPQPGKINEFVANHVGTDNREYFELYGSSNTDYSSYRLLDLEGDSGSPQGNIDTIITPGTTDANGLWVTAFLSDEFENGTITYLLVTGFSGTAGQDLDTNDDGTLDFTPWTAIVDSVSVNDGGTGDLTYATPVLVNSFDGGSFAVGGASRIPNGTDTNTAADWFRNDFDLFGVSGFTGTYVANEAVNTRGLVNTEAPALASISPADSATDVPPASNIVVNFSEAVTFTGSPFTLTCNSVSVPGTFSGSGTAAITFNPTSDLTMGESCTVTIAAGVFSDADRTPTSTNSAFTSSFTVGSALVCDVAFTEIPTLQENGTNFGIGGSFTIEGIVTGDFQTGLSGFYMQSALGDGNTNTSDGIFVSDPLPVLLDVAAGERVRVTGTVSEGFNQTQITATAITSCGDTGTITAVSLTLPFASTADAERRESMLVSTGETLTVNETFNLGQFGEIVLGDGRVYTPTQIVQPGAPAVAQQAANALNRVLLDDGRSATYPDPTPYLFDSTIPLDGADRTLRVGDSLTSVTGVMGYGFNNYRIQPTTTATFTRTNPRPTTPPAFGGANVRVASFNVLNYFNGDGLGGGFPTSRGANTLAEFNRQRAKTIAAIVALNADAIGLMEMENDSTGANSAIQDLVNGLNAATAAGTYSYIDTGVVGSDEIRMAILYKPGVLTPFGSTLIDNAVVHNRPPVAQAFTVVSTGGRFTLVVNHFKSKGCGGSTGLDQDQGDGQSCFNPTRVAQANALISFISGTVIPTVGDSDVISVGDYNAYLQEDPIDVLTTNGTLPLVNTISDPFTHSYVFMGLSGSLDHALVTSSLSAQVVGAEHYPINGDEPIYIDYNVENKTAAQQALNENTPYRSSDHDPVVVGLNIPTPFSTLVEVNRTLAGMFITDDANAVSEGAVVGDRFGVRLASAPVSSVTVTLTSAAPADLVFTVISGWTNNTTPIFTTPSSFSLTFTPANWNTYQIVNLYGLSDAVSDAGEVVNVTFTTSSGDGAFNNLTLAPQAVTIYEPGLTISNPPAPITEGSTSSYQIVLNGPPAIGLLRTGAIVETVSVTIRGYQRAYIGVTPFSNIPFSRAAWNTPVTIAVRTSPNTTCQAAQYSTTAQHALASTSTIGTDTPYGGPGPNAVGPDLLFTIIDTDCPLVTPTDAEGEAPAVINLDGPANWLDVVSLNAPIVEGAAGVQTLAVRLGQPVLNGLSVTLDIVGDGNLNGAQQLTFNETNWDQYQIVTLTAADDAMIEGLHAANIAVSANAGLTTDAAFLGWIVSAQVIISDNDLPTTVEPLPLDLQPGIGLPPVLNLVPNGDAGLLPGAPTEGGEGEAK